MGKNKGSARALTQEEIWDDSALVQSWDEAVEEYKLYHSIAAKGESVEDVLREAEDAAKADEGPSLAWAQVEIDDDMADADVDASGQNVGSHVPLPSSTTAQVQPDTPTAAAPTQPPPMSMPVPMQASQSQDEGLKNLMMSWYYAGYYTAVYEEQQRASANAGAIGKRS